MCPLVTIVQIMCYSVRFHLLVYLIDSLFFLLYSLIQSHFVSSIKSVFYKLLIRKTLIRNQWKLWIEKRNVNEKAKYTQHTKKIYLFGRACHQDERETNFSIQYYVKYGISEVSNLFLKEPEKRLSKISLYENKNKFNRGFAVLFKLMGDTLQILPFQLKLVQFYILRNEADFKLIWEVIARYFDWCRTRLENVHSHTTHSFAQSRTEHTTCTFFTA